MNKAYTLEITTTQECNLGCTYCFEGCGDTLETNYKLNTKKLSFNIIKEKIDSLLLDNSFNTIFQGGLNIHFWGGEPTLESDLITQIMLEYKDEPRVNNYSLSTNGYDIRPTLDIIKLSKKLNIPFSIQISYDGGTPNSLRRLTLTGKDSSIKVRKNILKLLETDIPFLSLKATIQPNDFRDLLSAWEDYEDLFYEFKKVGRPLIYKPTIDYHNIQYKDYLEDWKQVLKKIAKKEISFYKKNKKFLWEWMDGGRLKCSAGINMSAINVDGEILYCHGAIYLNKKSNMIITNISNKDIFSNINETRNQLMTYIEDESAECSDCIATVCMRCPVNNIELSSKNSSKNKWNDNSHNTKLCSYFKEFGLINHATIKALGIKYGT